MEILTEGHIRSDLVQQFGVKRLSSRAPFIPLLYYLGMLTLRDAPRDVIGKDTRRLDEKTIKLLFMTYVSLGRAFHPLSEKEFAQGYCDLFLGVSKNVAGARYSWLLEFKYLPTGAKAAKIEAAFAEAEAQVQRYASDKELLPLLLGDRELKAGMIVFVGTKRALFRPWPPKQSSKQPQAKAAKPRPARRGKKA